jgi:tetratricopeptide (TPR) repeat protein
MKYFLLLFVFAANNATAQLSQLEFNKRFVECEDRWVAFQKGRDSTQAYGFIYIDTQAGLTFNYEGSFTISPDGKFIPKKMEKGMYKVRLQPNNVQVALIPEERFAELQIAAVPEWLHIYKSDTASAAHFYRWGFMYNGWGECAKALGFLKRAETMDANFKGLAVELAYSYNCLQQYDLAIKVLQKALEAAPTDAYVNKELVFALAQSGDPDKAAIACEQAMEICEDKTYDGENCYNVLQSYYHKKDKGGFSKWLPLAKQLTEGKKMFEDNIRKMETQMGVKN